MLKLTNITKDYKVASGVVHALRGVSLEFRKNEFVCILGQSGCGKTTLLNIIGGLDHYTAGDLVIQGKSTKDFKDRDWDVYRNHRIGFIFQTYNLIPHQTVLANVELALTIAGVGKEERKRRAQEALERVGLGPISSRAGRCSASRSPVPSSTIPIFCSPMNPRAPSTARRACRSWTSSVRSRGSGSSSW